MFYTHNLRNSCTIEHEQWNGAACVCVFFRLSILKHRCVFFWYAWVFLIFLSTWFRIKNQTQIISTSMALENLLFNHFNSRLAMTGLFFQDCRAPSYPVFLFISQFEECKSMIIIIAPSENHCNGWMNYLISWNVWNLYNRACYAIQNVNRCQRF